MVPISDYISLSLRAGVLATRKRLSRLFTVPRYVRRHRVNISFKGKPNGCSAKTTKSPYSSLSTLLVVLVLLIVRSETAIVA